MRSASATTSSAVWALPPRPVRDRRLPAKAGSVTSTWIALASGPVQLTPARSQMGFTLAFHILLVPIGVALPTIMLIANYKGIKHGDAAALSLARRWSHAAGLTFAVGAVTGTVLSFEFGLLWPNFTRVFGDVFGLPFAI